LPSITTANTAAVEARNLRLFDLAIEASKKR